MIANFVLNGLEEAAFIGCKKTQQANIIHTAMKRSNEKEKAAGAGKYVKVVRSKMSLAVSRILVRFADDFIVITTDERDIPIVKSNIENFLKARGVTINEKKSRVFK